MKNHILYAFCFSAILLFGSCKAGKTDSKRIAMEQNKAKFDKKISRDTKFAVCAADAGMLEEKLSELSQTNAIDTDVKQFGKRMMSEHSKMNNDLKKVAFEKKMSLPDKLSDKSQKAYDKLSKKTGNEFDKAYMKCLVKHHKMNYCAYKKEAKKGNDNEIKKFASDNVPILKEHLESAKSTCKAVKKKK
jgi:putative membrane protein